MTTVRYSMSIGSSCRFFASAILFPIFKSNQKSCFAKATNRNAENILEIYCRPATSISCSCEHRKVLSGLTFSVHLSP